MEMRLTSSRTRARAWRCPTAAALLALMFAAGAGSTARAADPPSVFSVDVVLAPVQIDGTFPLSIALTPTALGASLDVDTDVRGNLKGSLAFGARTFSVKGRATYGRKGTKATFTATSGRDRITFTGEVDGTTLSGRATGKGAVAAGKHAFTADLQSAGPLLARLEGALREDSKGRVTGTARVVACGDTVALKVGGSRGRKSYALSLRAGNHFKFSGRGPAADGIPSVDWTVSGFGATAKGDVLALDPLEAPSGVAYPLAFAEFETELGITPFAPVSGTAPRATFAIAPSLPAGLVLDAATGAIAGTPSELRDRSAYTVTVSNFAGTIQTSFDLKTRIQRAKSFAPETRTLTDDDLRHFLGRTQFGVTQASLDRVRTVGLDTFIDGMLVFGQNGPADTLAAPELVNASDPVGLEGMFPSQTQLGRWWTSLMVNTDNPFQERVAFFWHDLFAASSDVLEGGEAYMMRDYVNLFRYEGNGNLRSLLLKMSRSGCMLKYLDGYQNRATAPNENFAREFWELFTLGVDNGYTQEDIVQASMAFTGYKRSTNATTGLVTMVFDKNLHDAKAKTILGQTIPGQNVTDDYQAVVDITVDHAPVAEFIVTKLFEHFGFARPSKELVDAMAADLRGSGYDLSHLLRSMFRSEAFFSATARRSLVKNPVDFGVGFIRTTGLKLQVSTLGNQLSTLAQFPTQPPTVNGWPQGDLWLSAQNMTDRLNLVYQCVEDTSRQTTNGINVSAVLPPTGPRAAPDVVDYVASILDIPLTAAERQKCIDYLNTAVTGSASAPVATVSTFDATIQSQLDTRLRGLLYILAQHPAYELR